jgi:hypothetical protein
MRRNVDSGVQWRVGGGRDFDECPNSGYDQSNGYYLPIAQRTVKSVKRAAEIVVGFCVLKLNI